MENLRTKIQTTFVERAPNSLTLNNLAKLLQGEDLHAIEKELQKMVSEGVLVERSAGRNKDYLLTSYSGIPVREFVSVGGVKVPRLLHGDTARPEDVNIFFEVLARRVLDVELEAERKIDERLKSYWGNIITLFGAFIGVFSLIVGFIKTAQLDKDATFVSVLSVSTAQILPLALVLGGFIWLLKSQFR
jgi:hypothetical protein